MFPSPRRPLPKIIINKLPEKKKKGKLKCYVYIYITSDLPSTSARDIDISLRSFQRSSFLQEPLGSWCPVTLTYIYLLVFRHHKREMGFFGFSISLFSYFLEFFFSSFFFFFSLQYNRIRIKHLGI